MFYSKIYSQKARQRTFNFSNTSDMKLLVQMASWNDFYAATTVFLDSIQQKLDVNYQKTRQCVNIGSPYMPEYGSIKHLNLMKQLHELERKRINWIQNATNDTNGLCADDDQEYQDSCMNLMQEFLKVLKRYHTPLTTSNIPNIDNLRRPKVACNKIPRPPIMNPQQLTQYHAHASRSNNRQRLSTITSDANAVISSLLRFGTSINDFDRRPIDVKNKAINTTK